MIHTMINKILLFMLLIISKNMYAQVETYTNSSEEYKIEYDKIINLNLTKIHDTVNEKAKLKTEYQNTSFLIDFKNTKIPNEIILEGVIERDGTITGLNFTTIKDLELKKITSNFFRNISNQQILEPAIINHKFVRSKVIFKLLLYPKLNCLEILIL